MYPEKYSPHWAPHVDGSYTERVLDPETGAPEKQWVHARCGICGEEMRRPCDSGRVRMHVANFALLHLHRDPLSLART